MRNGVVWRGSVGSYCPGVGLERVLHISTGLGCRLGVFRCFSYMYVRVFQRGIVRVFQRATGGSCEGVSATVKVMNSLGDEGVSAR